MNETMNEQTGEVVDGQLVRQPPREAPVDLLAVIEQRNSLLERVLEYAIKATHPEQWFDLGGKPWPSGPACEAMARRCGVSITDVSKTKRKSSDDKGDFYIWEVTGTASLPSGFDTVEAFGTCSSRDNFLGTETGAGRKLSEIDEGNVMKAAYTNMEVNAITRLLGVRNLSWERLGNAGLDRSKMGKVEYGAGTKGGGQKAAGGDLEIKFGSAKGKTIGQLTDAELDWYLAAFERDFNDPAKEKYKKNAEKQLTAAKDEKARRANAAANPGSTPPGAGKSSYWDRLKQLAGALGFDEGKLKAVTRQVLKKEKPEDKVNPGAFTEADFKNIADALELLKKEKGDADESF